MTYQSDKYSGRWSELEDFYNYQFNNKKMEYFKALGGAVVSGVIVAVLGYLVSVGDIWNIDFHTIVNTAVLTGAASILKYLGTSNSNKFLNVVPLPE